MLKRLKKIWSYLSPYVRWAILGGVLFFLGQAIKSRWQEVLAIRISGAGLACLAIALGITLLAHICAGWIWIWILKSLQQPVPSVALIQAYLKATIAKYLPGNVWHYYGRIDVARKAGVPLELAALSTLLEPLLMAAAALVVTLLGSLQLQQPPLIQGLQVLGLIASLTVIHPWVLNPVLHIVGRLKLKALTLKDQQAPSLSSQSFRVDAYPLLPLLGNLLFLLLRGLGFLLILLALGPVPLHQIPFVFSAFSLAWLMGTVAPGFPGGIGVFEPIAIALLGRIFPFGVTFSAVALYRLISTLAEAAGAGLVWLDEQRLKY